ncbi:hypothetical protein SAMN05216251_114119 [Actinacidiphila alni]|uniref:Uncharacterized protein n=1 Tax=Actinacidiphila alni TaxID=380248 RepID=A0A1I2IQA9_9ACTN|nr:hypothetical protein SAMN05216251_114119 [Actinacidiphila alni]
MLGLLGWGAASVLGPSSGLPDNHVAAADPRVCPDTGANNISLAEAAGHFGLVVPAAAAHLVFTASKGGLQGETDLSMRFTTTPADLIAFLGSSRLDPPSTTAKVTTGDWDVYGPGVPARPAGGPCGLNPPVARTMKYSEDGPDSGMRSSPRTLAVDGTTDPAHPVVWVTGTDL